MSNPVEASTSLEIGPLVIGLVGGLALFLFGMDLLTRSLKILTGARMRSLLGRITTNPVKGALAGAATTAVIQSSSVTTVLIIGFISAGLVTLPQAIGVIMGANIGTTITAQMVAFKITQYALVLVSVGFFWKLIARAGKGEFYGSMIMGLGLIFFGMELMSEATNPLRNYQPFIDAMHHMRSPVLGILIGGGVTALVQSSSATTVMVIVLASQGYITLEAGIALIFGANLGTCVTAMLGTIGKPREALQAALAHLFFNLIGVLLWLAFIPELAEFVRSISPQSPGLAGADKLGAETPRQIANAHTVFNVANTVVLIWLARPLAFLIRKLVPEKPEDAVRLGEPKFLDEMFLETPETALELIRKELSRLSAGVLHMLHGALRPVLHGSVDELQELRKQDDEIDALQEEIVAYIGKLSLCDLTADERGLLRDHLMTANHFENIGDMIETDLVEAGLQRNRLGLEISPGTDEALSGLHRKICWALDSVAHALIDRDYEAAREVINAKKSINELDDKAETRLLSRLSAAEPQRSKTFRVETDLIENLKRIYYFAKRIARVVERGECLGQGPGTVDQG